MPGSSGRRVTAILAGLLVSATATLPAAATGSSAGSPDRGDLVERPIRSSAPDRRLVKLSYVRQYEPLPAALNAPSRCDWIGYLRFRHRRGPAIAAQADAVLVAMPGFLGGASGFDSVARNLVRSAASQRSYFEFWALDRRSNCLEDDRGVRAADRAGDYRPALDYYWQGGEIRGRRFSGFKTDREVPYLAEFGLAQTMEDEYAVITRGIPRASDRKTKVFCGGQSLGGSLTGAFASWDFDDDPATTRDAGYNQCAGYFGLDTAVTNNLGGISRSGGPFGDALYAAAAAGIRSGALPRFGASLPALRPELFQMLALAGVASYYQPEASGLLAELPSTPDIDLALRMVLSRDAVAFATGSPSPRQYQLSNEALLATLVDDNSQSIPALQLSVGTYAGGPVVDKDFPLPNAIRDLPLLGPELAHYLANTLIVPGASTSRLMIPATAGGPVYRWREYDRVGAPDAPPQLDLFGEPFTTPESEVSEIRQLARTFFEGPVNAWEQYFPLRLLMDDAAFLTGGRSGDLRAASHADGPQLRPYVEIIGGEGVVSASADAPLESGATPRLRVVVPGYNHVDVLTAAADQNGGGPELVSESLRKFVLEVIGARRSAPSGTRPTRRTAGSRAARRGR